MENWKVIEGFNDYEVSDLGRVRRALTAKFNHRTWAGRILRPGVDELGYQRVSLSKGGKYNYRLVHRLVAVAFIPNPDNLPEVNHLGKTSDCRAVKLEWRTHSGNLQHASKSGKFGEDAGVYLEKRRGHWVARYWSGGRHKHGGHHTYVGSFPTKREATKARRSAVKALTEVK